MEYASSSPSQGETAQAPCSDQQQSSVALSKAENTLTSIDTEKRDPNKLKRSRSGSSKPELEDDESHAKSAKTSSTATNTATTARNKSLDEAEEATLPEAASSTDNTSPRKYGIIPITPTSMLGKGKHSRAVEDISKMEGTLVASLSSDLAINLPGHISNLFASKTIRVTPCQCLESQCAQDCITSAYLDAYGWEYRSLLREAEEQEFNRDKYDQQLPEKSLGLAPLVSARILPPLEKRFREHTEWSGPRSIKWDLSNYIDRQPELAPRMRGILVDWIVELSEEYKLSPTTFHLAITLIDKALASKPLFYIQKELLQCLGW